MVGIKIAQYLFKVDDSASLLMHNNIVAEGMIDFNDQLISIKSDLSLPKKLHVVIHELLHGISDLYNASLSEEEVDMLAIGISTFMVDNVEFCDELLSMIKENPGVFPIEPSPPVSKKSKKKSDNKKNKGE